MAAGLSRPFLVDEIIQIGGANALKFIFSSDTGAGDPGINNLALNAASGSQDTATILVVDDNDAYGQNIAATLATWDDSSSTVKGILRIELSGDPSKWIEFSFSALAQPAGYSSFTLTYVNSSYVTFTAGDSVWLSFSRTGDAGSAGGTSGQYVPTLTNVANITSSSVSSVQFSWFQVGDMVTVMGQVIITATVALTTTTLDFDLPVDSNFGTGELNGAAMAKDAAGEGAAIFENASVGPGLARLQYKCVSTTGVTMSFILSYRVV